MNVRRILAVFAIVAVAVTAMAAKKNDNGLEARVAELEKQVAELSERLAEMDTAIEPVMKEVRAKQEIGAITAMYQRGQHLEAKTALDNFRKEYAGTEVLRDRRVASMNAELQVVGKPAPAQVNMDKWFVGEDSSIDLSSPGTNLVVFWEEWCPHCKREVPKLQETYDKYHERGLGVVAVTKISKSATEEKVTKFIETHELNFPMAKESGDLSRYFSVSGIPAAAVVKDGQIIWRGHPATLSDTLLESWL